MWCMWSLLLLSLLLVLLLMIFLCRLSSHSCCYIFLFFLEKRIFRSHKSSFIMVIRFHLNPNWFLNHFLLCCFVRLATPKNPKLCSPFTWKTLLIYAFIHRNQWAYDEASAIVEKAFVSFSLVLSEITQFLISIRLIDAAIADPLKLEELKASFVLHKNARISHNNKIGLSIGR